MGAGAGLVHQNVVVNHMLYGMGSVLALFGTYVFLTIPGAWHLDCSLRFLIEAWCPHRGSKTSMEAAIGILMIVGLFCCLWVLIRGIIGMVLEGGTELAKAARNANQQARKRIVQEYVVLNFDDQEEETPVIAEAPDAPVASVEPKAWENTADAPVASDESNALATTTDAPVASEESSALEKTPDAPVASEDANALDVTAPDVPVASEEPKALETAPRALGASDEPNALENAPVVSEEEEEEEPKVLQEVFAALPCPA
jgi:hypothetical protein